MSTELSTEEEKMAADMAAGMAPLIKNANLESMKMIKEGILVAINELTLFKDPTGILCLKEEDVMKAIEKGYKKQVDAYNELRKGTLASGDKDNLEQVHTIIDDIWTKARATPLPASNTNNSSNNSGYNTNNGNNTNSGTKLSYKNLTIFKEPSSRRKGLSRRNKV